MESDKILSSTTDQGQDLEQDQILEQNASAISGSVGACEVCGKPIYDLVYAECQNCGKLYHAVCLKKKSTVESCRHHHLTLRRQEKVG